MYFNQDYCCQHAEEADEATHFEEYFQVLIMVVHHARHIIIDCPYELDHKQKETEGYWELRGREPGAHDYILHNCDKIAYAKHEAAK